MNQANNARIAKNSAFLSIRMVLVLCISLYTTRLILQVLGVEDYGIYNVVAGFVSMLGFLNTSMSNGIQRFYNFEYGKDGDKGANRVFCNSLLIQLLLSVIVVVIAESFGLWYLYNEMVLPYDRLFAAEWIFHLSVISFVFSILQAPFTAAVMAHECMSFYAIVSIADAILKVLTILVVMCLGFDRLVIYGLLIALIGLFNLLLYYVYCKLHFREIELRISYEKTLFLSMFGFSGWNLFGSFSNMMRNQGINLILNLFFGPIVNAARGIAMQINAGVTSFVTSISTPVRPQVIQSYARGDIDRMMRLNNGITKFCMCVFYLLALPICVEINYVLRIWLGESIPEHVQAFSILVLMTSSILVPMSTLATIVHATGKMKTYQVLGSSVKFLSVPFAYFLLKSGYEPEWAFIMVLVFDLIGFILGLFIIKSLISFSIVGFVKAVIIPILPGYILGVVSTMIVRHALDEGVYRFLLVLLIGSIVSSITFYFIGLGKSEKQMIFELVSPKRYK